MNKGFLERLKDLKRAQEHITDETQRLMIDFVATYEVIWQGQLVDDSRTPRIKWYKTRADAKLAGAYTTTQVSSDKINWEQMQDIIRSFEQVKTL